jgi:integrase
MRGRSKRSQLNTHAQLPALTGNGTPHVELPSVFDTPSSSTQSNSTQTDSKPYRNFFGKKSGRNKITHTTGSTARNGDSVQRRRFQRGSVHLNKSKTLWIGEYAEYVLDAHGAEKRIRHQIVLCPAKIENKTTTKREAQRLLQPYVDRVNMALSAPSRERKSATFEEFAEIWERDYLSLSKPSTRSGTRSTLKRLKAAFGKKDMRAIDAGDIQRFIATSVAEGLDPKTIRNHWGTVSLIWNAALAQKYVDAVLPKPKLPRRPKKKAKYFTLTNVAKIIATSESEERVFYWLAAESGLRCGELAGLKVTDIDGERLTVNRSVWLGKEQSPKTNNAIRTLALSPQLVALLWEQIVRQKAKGHEYLFSSANGTPRDMNVHRRRKMVPMLSSLAIPRAGFHAFRHFNVALMDALRVPLKTVQERMGHAVTGSFTLDVYGGQPEWERNLEAARMVGAELEKAVNEAACEMQNEISPDLAVGLFPNKEKGSGAAIS